MKKEFDFPVIEILDLGSSNIFTASFDDTSIEKKQKKAKK